MKKYALREKMPDEMNKIFESYNPLTRELLFARDITDTIVAENFLNPDYKNISRPIPFERYEKNGGQNYFGNQKK